MKIDGENIEELKLFAKVLDELKINKEAAYNPTTVSYYFSTVASPKSDPNSDP